MPLRVQQRVICPVSTHPLVAPAFFCTKPGHLEDPGTSFRSRLTATRVQVRSSENGPMLRSFESVNNVGRFSPVHAEHELPERFPCSRREVAIAQLLRQRLRVGEVADGQ